MQYDVFISYARKDYEDQQTKEIIPGNIVARIKQLLDDNGLTYWFDEAGIYSGDQFAGVIADAIEQSMVFLYISTEASNESKWTINEIATAKHLDKKIIPFRYDESKYNKSILMYLAPLDHIEYPKNKDKAFGQLIASIKTYKHTLELAEQESRRAAELAKQREQEKLEKQKQELERQLRIQEVNKQLETLYTEIQKKQQERASINIVLDGLEKQRTNLENELAFLTGKASSFEPIIEEDIVVVPRWKSTLSLIRETVKRHMSRLYRILIATIAAFVILSGIILSLPSVRYNTPEDMFQRGNTYSQKGNIKKTIKWYRKAAERGHAEAQYSLGHYYSNGLGIKKDVTTAIDWYRKAAEQGFLDAQMSLGNIYYIGLIGIVPDTIQAGEWYRKAAEQGNDIAQYCLGEIYYHHGIETSPDTIQAVEWYRKAAEQGHTSAQHMMGIACENGCGVERSEPTAIEWYRKASKGTGPAQEKAKNALARLHALADGEANGHEYVDLGLSVKWATCNVGASSPSLFGKSVSWSEKDNWGVGWRKPTGEEMLELINKCSWKWTTQNNQAGYSVEGPNGNRIFLPASNSGVRYWSSTYEYGGDYYILYLYNTSYHMSDIFHSANCLIRLVTGQNREGRNKEER